MSIRLIIKRITSYLVRFVAFSLDLLGFKYIWYKLNPHKKLGKNEPKTIMLWLLSITAALFGVASSRYEQELTRLEYRVSNLVMQAESSDDVLSFIPKLQHRPIPYKPSILNPWSTIKSFLSSYDQPDADLVEELQDLAIKKKHKLTNLNLAAINFIKRDLSNARFESSDLTIALFAHSILIKTDFNNAYLPGSNFREAYLLEADLSNANLVTSRFYKANLLGANLKGANIYGADFIDTLLAGADFRNTDLGRGPRLYKARYNSKNVILGKLLTFHEAYLFCKVKNSKETITCNKEIFHYIIPPTKFPPGFNPKEHGMIDISELSQQENNATTN